MASLPNLEKIEAFFNDSAYKELLENSETYNTRLCIERRLRMPFLDPQTGVAQNHCALFMKRRQRMPGLRDGQIYSYPAGRWRKSRRQYLMHQHRPFRGVQTRVEADPVDSPGLQAALSASAAVGAGTGSQGSGSGGSGSGGNSTGSGGVSSAIVPPDTDSRDSHREDHPPKEWFYDEAQMHDIEMFEDRDMDSDFDYDESFKKKRRGGRKSQAADGGTPARGRGRGRGRGRRKAGDGEGSTKTPTKRGRVNPAGQSPSHSLFPPPSPSTCGSSNSLSGAPTTNNATPNPATPTSQASSSGTNSNPSDVDPTMPVLQPEQSLNEDSKDPKDTKDTTSSSASKAGNERNKATPSTYCDFCLGDSRENRKTNIAEDLVSCSDCGRSGHPSCLQFTPNMIISVRRYRWQCIECKYCSICGTSDNDDQLLFCDDCDRGYHMYCLKPALTVPPEGSWSCAICDEEFHKKKN